MSDTTTEQDQPALLPYPTPEMGTVQVKEIANLATRAADPKQLAGGSIYAVVDPKGGVEIINLDTDDYRTRPRLKTGTYTTSTPQAFTDYLEKHSSDDTEIWAGVAAAGGQGAQIVAVIDAHGRTEPGWGKHRVKLQLSHSPEWLRWVAQDRKGLTQRQFAELVEDRLVDIVEPNSADMLEIAQTFEARNNVRFASSTILASGERRLEYKEDIDASAGRTGAMTVPQTFTLALRPFMGGEAWKVEARFRYSIREGALTISYALTRPEDVIQNAFDELVANIDTVTDAPVYAGVPA